MQKKTTTGAEGNEKRNAREVEGESYETGNEAKPD